MDFFVRFLRDGRSEDSANPALGVIDDEISVLISPVLFLHAARELLSAMAAGRSQATRALFICTERAPRHYRKLLGASSSANVTYLDAFSGPVELTGLEPEAGDLACPRDPAGILRALQQHDPRLSGPPQPEPPLEGAARPQIALIFDDLTQIALSLGSLGLTRFLSSILAMPSVSTCLVRMHRDVLALSPPNASNPNVDLLSVVRHLAGGALSVTPVPSLQHSLAAARYGQAPEAELEASVKRRTGRLRTERMLACAAAPATVTLYAYIEGAKPQDLLGLGPSGAAPAGQARAQPDEPNSAEREARARVVLPFEHQGGAGAYNTGDFRDYLPQSAGGRVAPGGQRRLGTVTYVRDSEDEADSGEDPDEDLDI